MGKVSNMEGYPDRTADAAIAHVAKQQKRRKREKTDEDKRQTDVKKSHKNRQYPSRKHHI